jgi:hypothetical protein
VVTPAAIIGMIAPRGQEAVSSARVAEKRKKRGVFSRAFFNQYNVILLAGTGLFALATFSWLPLLIGAGAEALWMVLGADSGPFRRWVERQESKERQQELAEKTAKALGALDQDYVDRFDALRGLADRIAELAKENPSLGTRLVQGEMDKLGQLLFAWLEMAVLHERYAGYLEEHTLREIQRDIDRCERALADEDSAEVKASLRQNLELARKRLRQHERIEANHRLLSVKMDTLEKSFKYLQTHIIGIGKGEELTSELDGLIIGVEAVEEMTRESDALLGSAPIPRRAQAVRS